MNCRSFHLPGFVPVAAMRVRDTRLLLPRVRPNSEVVTRERSSFTKVVPELPGSSRSGEIGTVMRFWSGQRSTRSKRSPNFVS